MMPLTLANIGEENIIRRIGGTPKMRMHLGDLGFTAGGRVTVLSRLGGDLIVQVRESRIAISRETAQKILV